VLGLPVSVARQGRHRFEANPVRCGKGNGDVEAAALADAGGDRGSVRVSDGLDDCEAELVAAGALDSLGPESLEGLEETVDLLWGYHRAGSVSLSVVTFR